MKLHCGTRAHIFSIWNTFWCPFGPSGDLGAAVWHSWASFWHPWRFFCVLLALWGHGPESFNAFEEKARKSAVIAGYNVMGLLGLFILAKKLGFIDQVRPLIDELRRKKFRVSERVVSDEGNRLY